VNAKNILKAELDHTLIKLRAEFGNMPDTEDEAIDACYEKSAESFVHAFLSIFSPPSAQVLVDNAEEAGVSYKRSPAVDVLKSFVATINSNVKSRLITWGRREFEKLQGLLYDDQPRDPQAHSQHFSACRALFVQRFGLMKNDCLIGNSPQRNASTGSNSLTLEEIAEDSANVRTVVMQAGTFVGKVVSHGQVSNLNRETDSIIDVEVSSGHIVLMSRSEFKKECMSDRALVSYFEAHGLYCAMKASHQSDYEVNVKKLDNDHNLVVGGAHVPGWPSPPEGIVSAADQNAFNRRVSAFYINAKDNLKAELDRKLIKLRAEYGNMPDTEEGAKDVCYEKSAESFVHAFLSIFSPPSARVLVDNAREAGVSYKRSPAVDVLKSFVATINSYVKSRSIIWGGREFEKLQGLLYDDQARDPQAHSQHFSACRALFVQRYGKKSLFDPLLDLHLELRVLPEWPELVVIKSKYSALPCDVVTWETTDALWEEVGRCSSKRTWVRPQLLQPCSALPHDSPKQQARASGRVARVESRTEQDADASKGGHFTGKCHNCGEKGHMARECTSGVLCYNCGKKGHIASACSLPPSASRRERSRSRSPSRARSRSRPASRARTPAPQSQPTIKTGANGGGSSVRAASKTVTWKGPVAHKPSKETRSQPKEEPSKGEIAEKTATPSETTSAPPPATPEVRTLKVANASVLPTRAEGEVPIQFVKVDTGADVTGCDPRYLSEVKAEVAELSSFDGTKSKLTAKGVLGVVLADADDPSKTFELRIEAWACPGVGPVPLISMNDLLNVGVGAHLVPDGSSLDLTALGGPDIRIKGDGLVPVVRVLTGDDEDGWKTVGRSRSRSRPARSEPRFAQRQTSGSRGGRRSWFAFSCLRWARTRCTGRTSFCATAFGSCAFTPMGARS